MHDVRLGRSDLRVSAVAFGTWSFGGEWGAVDRPAAVQTVDRALELGINFFDTAQGYGFGAAERLLAEALWAGANREDVFVATKGGLRKDGDKLVRDDSAAWLRQGVDASLRNLSTDYIDLYQIHWPDLHTPAAETGEALAALVEAGKIRHVGVSNYSAEQMEELSRFVAVETDQAPYHLFRRDIEESVLPYCERREIGVIAYGALAHGLLTGAMDAGTSFAADDWRSKSSDFSGQTFTANLAVVERLKAFAADRGVSLPQLAIAWTLAHPAVDVALVGARNPEHLDDSVAAADVKLEDDDIAAITRIVADGAPVRGPSPEGM